MMRAEKVVPAGEWTGEPADAVVLEFDERFRRRAAMTGVGGLAFQLDLAEPTMLRGGDGLRLEDGRILEVVAAPEPLFEIRASDPASLLRVALRLGNHHAPAEVSGKALRVRRDPEIEQIAKALGARVTPVEAAFNPEGAAYVFAEAAAHAHWHHGHERHDHTHDHDHHSHSHSHHAHHHGHHDHADEHEHADERHAHDHSHDHSEHQHHADDRLRDDHK